MEENLKDMQNKFQLYRAGTIEKMKAESGFSDWDVLLCFAWSSEGAKRLGHLAVGELYLKIVEQGAPHLLENYLRLIRLYAYSYQLCNDPAIHWFTKEMYPNIRHRYFFLDLS